MNSGVQFNEIREEQYIRQWKLVVNQLFGGDLYTQPYPKPPGLKQGS